MIDISGDVQYIICFYQRYLGSVIFIYANRGMFFILEINNITIVG